MAIKKPSLVVVNASLMLVQVLFGFGGVITALGLPASNPFAFALYREVVAGGLLFLGSVMVSPRSSLPTASATASTPTSLAPQPQHYRRFLWLGLAIWGNQAAMICGIKLAGAVAAAVWQPSQPIMTAAISMALQWEPWNTQRVAGIIAAFCACALMVIITSTTTTATTTQGEDDSSGGHSNMTFLAGNVLFFLNCLATSLYVILSKQALRIYSSLTVTAWSYNIAAVIMAATALLTSTSTTLMDFLCPDCTSTWGVPTGAYWALLYSIVFNSIVAYAILTWANQYATGTLVMGYTVLQPVTAALFTMVLLGLAVLPNCNNIVLDATNNTADRCLFPPGIGSVCGMVGVFVGLYLVIVTEPKVDDKQHYEEVPFSANNLTMGTPESSNKESDGMMMVGGRGGLQERANLTRK